MSNGLVRRLGRVLTYAGLWLGAPAHVGFAAGAQGDADRGGGPASPSVAELRAAYAEQVTSIKTLSAVYTISHPKLSLKTLAEVFPDAAAGGATAPIGESPTGGPGGDYRRCRWTRDGEKIFFSELPTHPTEDGAGVGEARSVRFDGVHFYTYRSTFVKQRKAEQIQIYDRQTMDPIYRETPSPEHLLGTVLANTDLSLTDLLASPDVRVAGPIREGSERLWRLELASFPGRGGSFNMAMAVDLDPAHDYLPRRIRLTEAIPPGGAPRFGGWTMEWLTGDLAPVRDQAAGRDRWFPRKGVLVQQADAITPVVRLESLEINAPVPEATFQPPVSPGARALDKTANGRSKPFVIGTEKNVDEVIDAIAREGTSEANKAAPVRKGWMALLVGNAVVFALGAVWIFRRQRARAN